MTKSIKNKSCWLLFDAEKKGSENQCRGLADALDVSDFAPKPIPMASFLRFLPRRFWGLFLGFGSGIMKTLSQDMVPDVVISSGTRASVVAAFIKEKHPSTKVINLLNPRLPLDAFDLVVAPEHDGLKGSNVLTTLGSLHGITPQSLKDSRVEFQDLKAELPSNTSVITVLVGGPSRSFAMGKDVCSTLGSQVAHLSRTKNAYFLVSFSRRTPDDFKAAFLESAKGVAMTVFDPKTSSEPNPYVAYLALADHIIVTADSISMTVEACATGKPVQVMGVQTMPRKFRHFHKALEKKGATKPFKGSLDRWDVVPLQENQRLAKEVRTHL